MINIYTDGAYSSKKESGGWSCYCPELKLKMCGKELNTTNNRMELTAVIKILEFLDMSKIYDKEIIIWSDSKYLVETMNGNFKKKTNLDLWDQLDMLIQGFFMSKITWKHIKGHTGEQNGNNIADILANLISQL